MTVDFREKLSFVAREKCPGCGSIRCHNDLGYEAMEKTVSA
ncbi:hypothetical protein [Mesorhizobium sp.]|nr:hypothetical protein [Mesorhizobium sp.]